MNMSNCAMSKENTPIFSCVDDPVFTWDNDEMFDFDEFMNTPNFDLTKHNKKCENHRDRLKDDNSTFIGSWRCPDFWQALEDTLNHNCTRPGMLDN